MVRVVDCAAVSVLVLHEHPVTLAPRNGLQLVWTCSSMKQNPGWWHWRRRLIEDFSTLKSP